MTTDRDIAPLIRSWLHDEADEPGGHVLDRALAVVDVTEQRPAARWPARRPQMNTIVRFGIAAAVLAMAVALGYGILQNVGSRGPAPSPSGSPSPSPSPSPSEARVGCLDLGMLCAGVMDAGEHASRLFDPYSEDWTKVVQRIGALTFEIPEGWANADDRTHFYTLLKADAYTDATPFNCLDCPDGIWIGADPAASTLDCTEQADEAVGTSAQELADWIRAHPALNVTDGPVFSVDDRQTFVLDVVGSDSYADACVDPELSASFVPLFTHPGYTYGIRTGDRGRLILVEIETDRAMLIGVDSFDPDDIEAVIAETQPIIESIQLTAP